MLYNNTLNTLTYIYKFYNKFSTNAQLIPIPTNRSYIVFVDVLYTFVHWAMFNRFLTTMKDQALLYTWKKYRWYKYSRIVTEIFTFSILLLLKRKLLMLLYTTPKWQNSTLLGPNLACIRSIGHFMIKFFVRNKSNISRKICLENKLRVVWFSTVCDVYTSDIFLCVNRCLYLRRIQMYSI